MKNIFFLLLICGLYPASLLSQDRPEMVAIPGGTFLMGGGYQYELVDFRMHYLGRHADFDQTNQQNVAIGEVPPPNNGFQQVTVSSFYLSQTEVSNAQYRAFLVDELLDEPEKGAFLKYLAARKKIRGVKDDDWDKWQELYALAAKAELLPDTACWVDDFSRVYNDPLVQNYFQHPAFDAYPVVGVSWKQARAYCAWLSRVTNAENERRNRAQQPGFRLPTEAEWEFAGRAASMNPSEDNLRMPIYPWPGSRVVDEKGQYRANIKTGRGDYFGDGHMYTAPVGSFAPNAYGLYNMAGNVSEWVEDVFRLNEWKLEDESWRPDYGSIDQNARPRVVKGGSWADYQYAAMCGSRTGLPEAKGFSRVGFRVARNK